MNTHLPCIQGRIVYSRNVRLALVVEPLQSSLLETQHVKRIAYTELNSDRGYRMLRSPKHVLLLSTNEGKSSIINSRSKWYSNLKSEYHRIPFFFFNLLWIFLPIFGYYEGSSWTGSGITYARHSNRPSTAQRLVRNLYKLGKIEVSFSEMGFV